MKVLITYPNSFPSVFLVNEFEKHFTVCKKQVDYTDLSATKKVIKDFKPNVVILSVPFAGGIRLNIEKPGYLIAKNLAVQYNVITESLNNNVEYLYFIGSSCMYPKNIEGKISEQMIMKGELEQTNLAYATAKLAGYQMCSAFNIIYNGPHNL
jgi:nucleoside-diphosphate-sugar epimerase